MKTFEEILLAETSKYEFKEALEIRKPKDWLKTVSAFVNSAVHVVMFDDRREIYSPGGMRSGVSFHNLRFSSVK
ncbi:MAG: hypothetical protein LBQ48_04185 [Oscillospiraceae bacterium]|jgi:predicted HTH transcriptional regulator|nr:hypothetical protein [Oscillospiraceae bacterium]